MTLSRRPFVRRLGGAVGFGGLGAAAYGAVESGGDRAPPRALVAGSLLRFARRVPGASVEAHGSAAVRRMILNDMRDPDAVALADPRLFEGISRRADLFATNALVLAYSPDSAYATEIRRDWTAAVERREIRLGRTDPTTDPLGYRTLMALRLAEAEYGLRPERVLNNATIFRETDMLNVVEGGKIDGAFAYRNMAVQRDLPYVELPDRIDFSNPAYADAYARVSYDLGGTTVRGAPIRYGATALTERGRSWTDELVTATERLRRAGFVVPPGYPRRDAPLPAVTGRGRA